MGKEKKPWKQKQSMMKPEDSVMEGGKPTDIVIPVMGPTGVGKSTFINILLGQNRMTVGHEITSCTSKLEYAVVDPIPNQPTLSGRRLVIVDTPGFDDTYEDDLEILRRISVWLASSYDDGMKLGGVIYLQNIAEKRIEGTTRRNLDMFRQLCGEDALMKVVLGTTNWGEVTTAVGEEREKQLRHNFWKKMVDLGSEVCRFENTQESARAMLDIILHKIEKPKPDGGIADVDDTALQIQKELVDLQRSLPETKAGKELRHSLQQLLSMETEMAKDGNPEGNAALAAKKQKILQQIRDLQVPLSRRILAFFGRKVGPSLEHPAVLSQ